MKGITTQQFESYSDFLDSLRDGNIFTIEAFSDLRILEQEYLNLTKEVANIEGDSETRDSVVEKIDSAYQQIKNRLVLKAVYEEEMREVSKRIIELVKRENSQSEGFHSHTRYMSLSNLFRNQSKGVKKIVHSISPTVFKLLSKPDIVKRTFERTSQALHAAEKRNRELETMLEVLDSGEKTDIQLLQFIENVKTFPQRYHYRDVIFLLTNDGTISKLNYVRIPLQQTINQAIAEIDADRGKLIEGIGRENTSKLKTALKAIVQGKINLESVGL